MESIDEAQDAMWRARVTARLAAYVDVAPLSQSGQQHVSSMEMDDEVSLLQDCFAKKIRGGHGHNNDDFTPQTTASNSADINTRIDEEEFPLCFYAQMLGTSPTYHQSVSTRATPQKPKRRASVLNLADEEKAFSYFGNKMTSNARQHKYGSGAAEGVYPLALIEHCDPSVIVKAQQCAAEINDLIRHVGRRNQVSEAARVQLMRSRCVSQMIVDADEAAH